MSRSSTFCGARCIVDPTSIEIDFSIFREVKLPIYWWNIDENTCTEKLIEFTLLKISFRMDSPIRQTTLPHKDDVAIFCVFCACLSPIGPLSGVYRWSVYWRKNGCSVYLYPFLFWCAVSSCVQCVQFAMLWAPGDLAWALWLRISGLGPLA